MCILTLLGITLIKIFHSICRNRVFYEKLITVKDRTHISWNSEWILVSYLLKLYFIVSSLNPCIFYVVTDSPGSLIYKNFILIQSVIAKVAWIQRIFPTYNIAISATDAMFMYLRAALLRMWRHISNKSFRLFVPRLNTRVRASTSISLCALVYSPQ